MLIEARDGSMCLTILYGDADKNGVVKVNDKKVLQSFLYGKIVASI